MENLEMTIKEFSVHNGIERVIADGFIKYLLIKGIVKVIGEKKSNSFGKSSKVYSIPKTITLNF